MIYLEHGAQISPLIFNNVLSYTIQNAAWKGPPFRTLMLISGSQNPMVFNNTIVGRNLYDDMSSGIDFFNTTNLVCKNNILAGMKNCIRLAGATLSSIDNNILWPVEGTSVGIVDADFCSWSKWRSNYGFDNSGVSSDPLFVSKVYPYDLSLQDKSPAINRGVDLTSVFNFDFYNTPRPNGTAWDIGAYQVFGKVKNPAGLKVIAP
jgi:hypothetical protein